MSLTRCTWFEQTKQLRDFHDQEWGDPIADADVLFEYVFSVTGESWNPWCSHRN